MPRDQRPALMLLTSHRKDCFALCFRRLEACTDLGRFEAVYILENDVEPAHLSEIEAAASRHANVEVVHCSPRGLVPAVMRAQNAILARHKAGGVVKLDEDVFVAPNWLESLLAAQRAHENDARVMMAGLLTPVSTTGRACLTPFIRRGFPDILQAAGDAPVYENAAYHELVWKAVLERDFVPAYRAFAKEPYSYVSSLIINCVFYDERAIGMIGPFPCEPVNGAGVTDEIAVNMALRRHGRVAVIPSEPLVHHYSHARCLAHMLENVPTALVGEWLERDQGQGLARSGAGPRG